MPAFKIKLEQGNSYVITNNNIKDTLKSTRMVLKNFGISDRKCVLK